MSELDGKYYVGACYEVSRKCATVTSNLAFWGAGMAEGDEDEHALKLARSVVSLRRELKRILDYLPKETVERAKSEEDEMRANPIAFLLKDLM